MPDFFCVVIDHLCRGVYSLNEVSVEAGQYQMVKGAVSGQLTVMVSVSFAVTGRVAVSVACTVTVVVPAVVEMPEITPLEFRTSPAGRALPDSSDQAYGVVPPVAVSCWLYQVLTTGAGIRAVVVMESRLPMPFTWRNKVLVVVSFAAVTVTGRL